MRSPLRGEVYFIDLGSSIGRKPFVVVSNNLRNTKLGSVIAIRITTSGKRAYVPTVVPLRSNDPLVGFALCDDIELFDRDELGEHRGALGPATMRDVGQGLRVALGLN
jgi:mRNA interferase MazF